MAKLNNKGISLVELLIAIAVMALLISPIIVQTTTTLNNSASAKEKQYVVDSAEEVMEYFRKTELSDLTPGSGDTVKISSVGPKTPVSCTVYNEDGASLGTISYSATDYTLEDAKLGKKQTVYEPHVTLSDLNNKLYTNGFQVKYDCSDAKIADLKSSGFDIGSDGTVATFDSNGNINGIVCSQRTVPTDLMDPNDVSLGNLQDMDASKMAIIKGDATSLDYKVESDITALLVQYAATHDETSLGEYTENPSKLTKLISSIMSSASTSRTRMIYLSVTAGKDDAGLPILDADSVPKYYTAY